MSQVIDCLTRMAEKVVPGKRDPKDRTLCYYCGDTFRSQSQTVRRKAKGQVCLGCGQVIVIRRPIVGQKQRKPQKPRVGRKPARAPQPPPTEEEIQASFAKILEMVEELKKKNPKVFEPRPKEPWRPVWEYNENGPL